MIVDLSYLEKIMLDLKESLTKMDSTESKEEKFSEYSKSIGLLGGVIAQSGKIMDELASKIEKIEPIKPKKIVDKNVN